jgi:hypothetical protein
MSRRIRSNPDITGDIILFGGVVGGGLLLANWLSRGGIGQPLVDLPSIGLPSLPSFNAQNGANAYTGLVTGEPSFIASLFGGLFNKAPQAVPYASPGANTPGDLLKDQPTTTQSFDNLTKF